VRAAAAGDVLAATATAGPPQQAAAAGDVMVAAAASPLLDIAGVVGPAALYTGQSMLMFAFASVAVEAGFRWGIVSRFPSQVLEADAALPPQPPTAAGSEK
jgi:hypothetical protein